MKKNKQFYLFKTFCFHCMPHDAKEQGLKNFKVYIDMKIVTSISLTILVWFVKKLELASQNKCSNILN